MYGFQQFACRVLGVIAAVVLIIGSLKAQTTGSISGTVIDSTNAAIQGATVTLINTDRNEVIRTLTTSDAGFYTANSLPLGTYTVRVSARGFKIDSVTGLVLHVSDALTVNRILTTGNITESVTVTADDLQLNMEDSTSQGLINSTQMNEMP